MPTFKGWIKGEDLGRKGQNRSKVVGKELQEEREKGLRPLSLKAEESSQQCQCSSAKDHRNLCL